MRRLDLLHRMPWLVVSLALLPAALAAQGVTTSGLTGFVTDQNGAPLADASIDAIHVPSGTAYHAVSRAGGAYNIPNMRVGGPYKVTVAAIGFSPQSRENLNLNLGQDARLDFKMAQQAIQLAPLQAVASRDQVLNSSRTGAATVISPQQVVDMPSIKRSTRDLTRLDPRSDGNYAFAGRNWLYNSISLDGSYFNNSFGLDDPAPGGQTDAEPVPYDAVEQVEVSVAPFDVRQGGFTGASVNFVTKSGTNQLQGSVYGYGRNDNLVGNNVAGEPVQANPDLKFGQAGFSVAGPLMRDKLFFFVDGELSRRSDPGSDFVASSTGSSSFGVSRVQAQIMDSIRNRMISAYNYDPGSYQNYLYHRDNSKFIAKFDWNASEKHKVTFRYNFLDAKRDLGPHPFVLSYANSGRGPNSTSLPFTSSGYSINNNVNSFALEVNSHLSGTTANRLFASFNRFRDHRDPNSKPYPTIEIGQGGVTYTTLGEEPFSAHNILNTDAWQFTDNFSWFKGPHVVTLGANYESFSFFNSFNIFRNGVFFLPAGVFTGTTFATLNDFFTATDPTNPSQIDFNSYVGSGYYKGENIHVGQLGLYAQDELASSERLNLTFGLRVDFPQYYTKPVDNPFSRGLTALDQNGNPEVVDQSKLPSATPLFSPRIGFNWNASGERMTQLRGGTGIFTGRLPFVWVGNVISNPGANPNLPPSASGQTVFTGDSTTLQQSFDLNAMAPNFKWPQVWTTDLAIDQQLPAGLLGTFEVLYSKDLHAVYMRNADLKPAVRTLPDGRPYYGGAGNNSLNPANGGAGIYVIDNTSEGHSLSMTVQLRKQFSPDFGAMLSYAYTDAKNNLKSTEIASVLWQNQPIQGNPNKPELSYSEFGQRNRIVGGATFRHSWSETMRTHVGVFLEIAEGNVFSGNGGNRYSFIYSGDVNGDGYSNDLIYVPKSQSEIQLDTLFTAAGDTITPQQQWNELNSFINQDAYLSKHRGQIAQRFGESNPWYENVDLSIRQDFGFAGSHAIQVSLDILNFLNLLSSDWGVRKIADPAATSPLTLTGFDGTGAPHFTFNGAKQTFINDPSTLSRWQMQLGFRYTLH